MKVVNIAKLFVLPIFYFSSFLVSAAEVINIGLSPMNKLQKASYIDIFDKFSRINPDISVRIVTLHGDNFQQRHSNLLSLHSTLDIVGWHAGERLNSLAEQNLIAPIDTFWQSQQLDAHYTPALIQSVIYQNKNYGVPYLYYPIGFYYKKSLFKQLAIKEPLDWYSFLQALSELKASGIAPIVIDNTLGWSASAWFEYLTLRMHGYQFYRQVAAGEVAFTESDKIRNIFLQWLMLLKKDYFLILNNEETSGSSSTLVARGRAGMELIGSFFRSDMPQNIQKDFGFFPFPVIENEIDTGEIAPTSAYVITSKTQKRKIAEQLLAFLIQPEHQQAIAQSIMVFSPHQDALSVDDKKMPSVERSGLVAIEQTDSITQFFNRETNLDFALLAEGVFVDFMDKQDVDAALKQLEKHRKNTFN